MKKVIIIFSFVFGLSILSATSQTALATTADATSKTEVKEDKEMNVKAYYFHFQRRCVSCRNVERVSSEVLQDLYGNKIKLQSVNLDEKAGEDLAKELGAEGQALLFINGSKKEDLLFDGFMYAMSDPERFKKKIQTTVESLTK
ncbi:MAG: nitrophenyl compound nitroreductase subunit ArsF family protein [Bacteroidales bacterium]|nr:nitrophenyl compound nitroreductase subunit ArsF family protein [Bacteroidales bacterium]